MIALNITSQVLLAKRLVVDLGTVDGVPGKIEGIARVDHDPLALINDNDFGIRGDDTKVLLVKGLVTADPAVYKK